MSMGGLLEGLGRLSKILLMEIEMVLLQMYQVIGEKLEKLTECPLMVAFGLLAVKSSFIPSRVYKVIQKDNKTLPYHFYVKIRGSCYVL